MLIIFFPRQRVDPATITKRITESGAKKVIQSLLTTFASPNPTAGITLSAADLRAIQSWDELLGDSDRPLNEIYPKASGNIQWYAENVRRRLREHKVQVTFPVMSQAPTVGEARDVIKSLKDITSDYSREHDFPFTDEVISGLVQWQSRLAGEVGHDDDMLDSIDSSYPTEIQQVIRNVIYTMGQVGNLRV
jgi:hypothetical protein